MAQLQFKGKQFVQNHHLVVKYHELVPQKDRSLTDKVSLHDNLIIHGDNLKALKALLPAYAGNVKCIYIDPPYNTGNENWVYNDNVSSPMMQEWLGKVVDKDDLTRHDKWLCMMMPRLKLLRELLRDDGVIFVSINDNEEGNLRLLMDEVFSKDNFVCCFIWNTKKGAQGMATKTLVVPNHEYILVYAKDIEKFQFLGLIRGTEGFSNPDKDPRGLWKRQYLQRIGQGLPERIITDPKTGHKYSFETPYSQEKLELWVKEGRIIFPKNKSQYPARKEFLKEYASNQQLITDIGLFATKVTTEQLYAIFGGEKIFTNPKPPFLIKFLLEVATKKDDIILDSFAGSGTTAHATLSLNKEDGGNRKFILVECEEYADEITAERIRRVIKGVPNGKDENLRNGLGGTFSYFELGKPIELESILSGKNLPTYQELARYVFYTATGEEFDESRVDESRHFIGESKEYEVYLFYQPDLEYLKNTALTLDRGKELGSFQGKKRLVFAPTKYLGQEYLDELRIDFAQLPFEIYKLAE